MSTPPLELTLRAPKPQWIVGEGIVLPLLARAHADLELESIDLNRDRTTIELTHVHDHQPSVTETLGGVDHCALHRVSMFQAIGERFSVQAGDEWESPLSLLLFRRPLPVGRYRVAVAYRYGEEAHEVVRSSAVELQVVPTSVDRLALRWFGNANPQEELASLWAAREGEDRGWWLQRARDFDPGVLHSAAAVGSDPQGETTPTLAHLNDITHMHFSRWVTWLARDALVVLGVAPQGRVAPPQPVAHGLGGPVVLADPPLQRRDGGLTAAVLGHDAAGAPVARLVHAGPNPLPPGDLRPLPTAVPSQAAHAVVAWHGLEDPVSGVLCWLEPGPPTWRVHALDLRHGAAWPLHESAEPLTHLLVDQWQGLGRLVVIGRRGPWLQGTSWPLDALEPAAARTTRLLDLAEPDPPWQGPHAVVTTHGGEHVAMLFEDHARWVVLDARGLHAVDRAQLPGAAVPWLVANREGKTFLVAHDPAEGFVVHAIEG